MKKWIFRPILISLLLLTGLVILTPFDKKADAQVTSGNVRIDDISIDSGGGKRSSGSVVLANTSIGQPFAGSVSSGRVTVCSGHACKDDFVATLGDLEIGPGPGASPGPDKLSGLRGDDPDRPQGTNVNNAITIHLGLKNASYDLAGVTFTKNVTGAPAFSSFLNTSDNENGFTVVYAKKAVTVKYYNSSGTLTTMNLNQGNFYGYFNHTWKDITSTGQTFTTPSGKDGVKLEQSSAYTSTLANLYFDVTLYSDLGNRTWDTYGFVFQRRSLGEFAKLESQLLNSVTLAPVLSSYTINGFN